MPRFAPETIRSTAWATAISVVVAALVVVGSRNLAHFDAALVGYTFATLFAVFAISYRYAMWLQRPPTALYWRRGWQLFFRRGRLLANLRRWLMRMVGAFALNAFIWRRDRMRGLAHFLIMWGCILAAAITFPLVFGWIHFTTAPESFDRYVVHVFGFAAFELALGGPLAFMVFHGLVWSSFLVIGGVMLAMRRRMRDPDAMALQQFGDDFLPLVLLFAISVTGLLLWASYTWMKGYGYDFLALVHAVTVILTLLWLPFGKLFHLFQRPAQLGVAFYRDLGSVSEQQRCARCDTAFASKLQVDDLIEVERALGYDYAVEGGEVDHYQRVCPRCRRAMLAVAQGRLWQDERRGAQASAGAIAEPIVDLSHIMPRETKAS
jgi:ribosomal protein S27AE